MTTRSSVQSSALDRHLQAGVEPPRQELLRRIDRSLAGVASIDAMCRDLLNAMVTPPELALSHCYVLALTSRVPTRAVLRAKNVAALHDDISGRVGAVLGARAFHTSDTIGHDA